MALVQSEGSLIEIDRRLSWAPSIPYGSLRFYGDLVQDYAVIYRTQPAVRTVIAFLARNIAQLALHSFRRVSDTDRERLTDHALARTLSRPNPFTTQHRLMDGTVHDLGIYANAYWVKVKSPGGQVAVVRVPAWKTRPIGDNWIRPDAYRIQGNRGRVDLTPEQVVHFRFYDPVDGLQGLPPLESLRRVLAEDMAAGQYREQFWRSGARISGVIKRPSQKAGTPKWSPNARTRFKESWASKWTGDGTDAGGTPILEDDMDFVPISYSARDSEFVASRKLTREEVASAYFVAPPFVGILDHATFSNITEQHKNLYQDTIGPWLSMIEQDVELQLFPDFGDVANVYVEFNIAEKLKGTFEEQVAAIQGLTGSPVMARNEGRGRLNLPRIDDPAFDVPVTPLNVLVGTIGDTTPAAPEGEPAAGAAARTTWIARKAKASTTSWIRKGNQIVADFFRRQERAVVAKLGDGKSRGTKAAIDDVFDDDRWNGELQSDLFKLGTAVAQDAGADVASAFEGEYDVEDRGLPYLSEVARVGSENVNRTTRAKLAEVLDEEDPVEAVRHVFEVAATARAAQLSQSWVTTTGNFGRHEAASDVGVESKTWVVTSGKPRPSHASMSGETVAVEDAFSNGARWPGDPDLPVDEVAGCTCLVAFG